MVEHAEKNLAIKNKTRTEKLPWMRVFFIHSALDPGVPMLPSLDSNVGLQ